MKTTLTILFTALAMRVFAQCSSYTVANDSMFTHKTTQYGDSIQCYNTCSTCSYNASFLVPPMDAALEIGSYNENITVVVRTACNKVCVDTCMNVILSAGIFGYIPYKSTDTTIVTVCAPNGTNVFLRTVSWMGSGFDPLSVKVLTDTLCPTMNLIQPKVVDTVFINKIDLMGRPYSGNGVCIEVIELMDGSFVTRKRYKFQ